MEVEAVDSPSVGESTSLNVSNVSFTPAPSYLEKPLEIVRYNMSLVNLDYLLPFYKGPTRKMKNLDGAPLRNVTFTANSSELVAILGDEYERHELVELLTGYKKNGTFDGSISLRGSSVPANSYYYNNVTFVQKTLMFIPGLTFGDMISHAVNMRVDTSKVDIDQRVDDILTIMNLHRCKDSVIAQFPPTKGESGCDYRRLSIALQIVSLPPLIVVDEPSRDPDAFYTVKILDCLKKLTKRGHIVVCSVSKPAQAVYDMFDRIVLLSEGYSIYAAEGNKLSAHFCTNDVGFQHKNETTTADFAAGVSAGTERSSSVDMTSLGLQEKFEASKLYTAPNNESSNAQAFSDEFTACLGLTANTQPAGMQFNRFLTVLKRAFLAKLKDYHMLFLLFNAGVIVATLIGYLQYGQGSYGNYCINIIGLPYKNTTNIGFVFFLFALFTQIHFFLETHTLCQKFKIFRYEQAAKVNNTAIFFVATLLSETPFALLYGLSYGSIVFGMTEMGQRTTDYGYFICVVLLSAAVGLSTSIMYSAMFKKEKAVRNMFFVTLVIMIMLSGYPFTQHNMPYYLVDFSEIIPTRWIYEGLFQWYFSGKLDGYLYLDKESYLSFERSDLFVILRNFLLIMNAITLVFLLPRPLLLRRAAPGAASSSPSSAGARGGPQRAVAYAEVGSALDDKAASAPRDAEEVVPAQTNPSPSAVVNRKKLATHGDEESDSRGTLVQLQEVSYHVRGATVLSNVSAQFEAGRLNMVLGASQSGKSVLLNVIAGNTGAETKVTGSITFDGAVAGADAPIFQRCGFVGKQNDQHRDLTVAQVLSFAMKLRSSSGSVEANVQAAMANLRLEDVADTKVKYLSEGERKRLSIAEEIAHGPTLLLLDEPTSDVDQKEASLLVTALREMVNTDRTVVASLFHPSVETYNMFDTVLLLSEGRVIYSGRGDAAVDFFTASPFQFSMNGYTNPADFLADISGGQATDSKGAVVEAAQLEAYYQQSDNYRRANPDAKPTATLEVGQEPAAGAQTTEHQPYPTLILALIAGFQFMTKMPSLKDFRDSLRIRQILLHRASLALLARYELIIATTTLHILLGILYGWVNKKVSPASVIAYLGVGTLFLLVAAAQQVFYIYTNYNVFLKEHARGLYSSYTNYTVHSIPLYALAAFNGVMFVIPSWGMMNQDLNADMYGIVILCFMFVTMIATMSVEVMVYLSNFQPLVHLGILLFGLAEFMICGLFLKSGSFRHWLEPWITSLSVNRWVMQACFVKLYRDDLSTFPLTFPNATFTLYNGYLQLFGWGGKTTYYCVGMLIINWMFFRFFTFLSMTFGSFIYKGTRKAHAAF